MPFSARVIETREDIPEVFQGNAVKVLEKANVSNMIGLLEQLNNVSKFASEVFADILKDTEKNSQRIKDCKTRISRIDTKVAPIEKMFVDRAPSYFYDNPYAGKEWKRRDALKGLIFRRDRSSMEVNRRRNEADPPPNLSALDNYSKGPCIKKFTDSNFFMNEWMEAEKKKIEEEKAKRKARKRKKKKKREEKKTIQKVKVKKFDPVTGKVIEVQQETVVVKQFTLTGDVAHGHDIEYGGNDDIDQKGNEPPNPPNNRAPIPGKAGKVKGPPMNPVKKNNNNGGPPPNPMIKHNGGPGKMNGAPPPFNPNKNVERKEDNNNNNTVPPPFKPPVFNPSSNASQLSNPMNNNNNNAPPPNPYSNNAPPPNPYAMEQGPSVQEKLSPMERAMMSAKMAEQSGMNAARAKPKPQMPGMKSNMLLASIKKGKNLRKAAAPVKRKVPQDKRTMLMSQLRQGSKLKKVESKKVAPKQKKPENEGIFAILNRRQYIADDDSDSDDDSGSWEDDD